MGKIVAIGGGENGRGEHPYETGPFDREIVRLTGKDDPNFLFIGLANSFADSYYATMCDIFHGRLGCTHTDHLTEADLRDPDTLRRKMEWADFIYVGGGNTLRLMTLLRRYGGDRLLDEAYKRGTVLSGVSAGGICWCSCGNSDSRKFTSGSDQLIKVTGLGYLPVLFCPHYDAEPLRQTDLPRTDAPGPWHACHRSGQRRCPGSGGRAVAAAHLPARCPGAEVLLEGWHLAPATPAGRRSVPSDGRAAHPEHRPGHPRLTLHIIKGMN